MRRVQWHGNMARMGTNHCSIDEHVALATSGDTCTL